MSGFGGRCKEDRFMALNTTGGSWWRIFRLGVAEVKEDAA